MSFLYIVTNKLNGKQYTGQTKRTVKRRMIEHKCGHDKYNILSKAIKKYGIDNLWKYNFPNAWRLIYSVARDEIIVVTIILEWMNHKEYEKRFNY